MGIAERLKYARQRAALTLEQVSERTGIGPSSTSEFENSRREPSLSQLHALATAYQRSVAFFLEEGDIPRETVLWREKPASEAEQIEAYFLRLCKQYHNLECWTDNHQQPSLPFASGQPEDWNYVQAERLAKDIRCELSLGDRPAFSLLSVLEEVCGVRVFHLSFEPTGTAASTLNDSWGAGILLNTGNVRWRRNFDLAHELFHLLTWPVFRSAADDATSLAADENEERLAGSFAASLLMPADAITAAFAQRTRAGRKLGYEGLYELARQFDVSAKAVLWRLHNLRLLAERVDTDQVKDIAGQLASIASIYEERRETETPAKWPERYEALAIQALRSGNISIGRFAEYMEVSRPAAMKLIPQEPTDGQEVPLAPA